MLCTSNVSKVEPTGCLLIESDIPACRPTPYTRFYLLGA